MHLAAERGLVEVAEALLEKGGLQLFGMSDGDNWLPEATAEYYGHKEFVTYCRKLEAKARNIDVDELPPRAWRRALGDGPQGISKARGRGLVKGARACPSSSRSGSRSST